MFVGLLHVPDPVGKVVVWPDYQSELLDVVDTDNERCTMVRQTRVVNQNLSIKSNAIFDSEGVLVGKTCQLVAADEVPSPAR